MIAKFFSFIYLQDKTQTLRFTTSLRSFGDCKRSHSVSKIPMVSYNVHFCANPSGKRPRCIRNTRFNGNDTPVDSASCSKSKIKSIQYSLSESQSSKGEKIMSANTVRFCKNNMQDIKSANVYDSPDEIAEESQRNSKDESGGCFKKKKKFDDGGKDESRLKDFTLKKHYKSKDCKENRRSSIEFSASFANSDSSHSSTGGPCYRGVVMKRSLQPRCYGTTKWDMGVDLENVETEIFIFPEGDKNFHSSSDEIAIAKGLDETSL